jgi:hypothetical protein
MMFALLLFVTGALAAADETPLEDLLDILPPGSIGALEEHPGSFRDIEEHSTEPTVPEEPAEEPEAEEPARVAEVVRQPEAPAVSMVYSFPMGVSATRPNSTSTLSHVTVPSPNPDTDRSGYRDGLSDGRAAGSRWHRDEKESLATAQRLGFFSAIVPIAGPLVVTFFSAVGPLEVTIDDRSPEMTDVYCAGFEEGYRSVARDRRTLAVLTGGALGTGALFLLLSTTL